MMKKDVNRKQYEPEFKQNAVKLTEKIGVVSTAYQVSVSINQHRTDIFIGELETDQVLVVQHHQSVVVSVTQTVYGQKDHVTLGKLLLKN